MVPMKRGGGQGCLRDEGGAVVVMVALLFTVLFGFVAIGVETGYLQAQRRSLQTAADAAAVAGALERARGNSGTVVSAGRSEALRNGVANTGLETVTINSPPLSGTLAGNANAVEAIVTREQPALFSSVFNAGGVVVTTRAVAMVGTDGSACVLALETQNASAVRGQGSATVTMPGCMIAANSSAVSAIDFTGNITLTAQSLWTAGTVASGGSSSVTLAKPGTERAWPLPDPYGSVDVGPIPACTATRFRNGDAVEGPVTLCDDQLDRLNNFKVCGPIYFDGVDLTLNNVTITMKPGCTRGATLVFTRQIGTRVGGIDSHGNVSLTLVAPSGAGERFRGIAIYQDRRAAAGGVTKINGNGTINVTGALYFPSQTVWWNGNASTTAAGCLQIVAREVVFLGNSSLSNQTCAAAGASPISTSAARLSE